MTREEIGCGVKARYADSRGSRFNNLLPCPSCGEDNQLTSKEIAAGKKCAQCVEEDKLTESDYLDEPVD